MNERRRFLQVIGGTAVVAGCGGGTGGGTGGGGAGGSIGTGGSGGDGTTSSSSTSTSSSSSTSTSSTSTGSGCSPTGVNVGMASKYATEGLYQVPGTTVLIGRDAGGLYARSSLCTHNSCDLNTKGDLVSGGIECLCHGSAFDLLGNVTSGPAVNPLKSFQLTLECDGNLWVDKTKQVPATQRLMP